MGRKKTFSFLFSLKSSISRPEDNEPARKEKIKKSKEARSLINKAKCPVTLVVACWKARKPVILTMPATKDSTVAMGRLCFNVPLLP